MKGEFERTLTVTENEREVISTFVTVMEEVFNLDLEEEPMDLFEIIYAIAAASPKAYLYNDKGTIKFEYQDD